MAANDGYAQEMLANQEPALPQRYQLLDTIHGQQQSSAQFSPQFQQPQNDDGTMKNTPEHAKNVVERFARRPGFVSPRTPDFDQELNHLEEPDDRGSTTKFYSNEGPAGRPSILHSSWSPRDFYSARNQTLGNLNLGGGLDGDNSTTKSEENELMELLNETELGRERRQIAENIMVSGMFQNNQNNETTEMTNYNNHDSDHRPHLGWQTLDDTPRRREMIKKIQQLLNRGQPPSTETERKLQIRVAKQLEVSLYRNAQSLQMYMDMSTLKQRLQQIAGEVVQRGQNQKHWKYGLGEVFGLSVDDDESYSNDTTGAVAPPKTSTTIRDRTSEHEQEKIRNKRQRLILLFHAQKCPRPPGQCTFTRHCAYFKQHWKHIAHCKNQECKEEHCLSSRYILSHYRRCKHESCNVCGPVEKEVLSRRSYHSALMEGKDRPRSIRVMTSGPWGVGKTSLVRSLLTQPFQETHDSTEGIDVQRYGLGKSDTFHSVFLDWAMKNESRASENSDDGGLLEDALSAKVPQSVDEIEGGLEDAFKVADSRASTFLEIEDEPPRKKSKVEKDAVGNSFDDFLFGEDGISMRIWDFAGQLQYHNMHQVFFQSNCIYMLVLDLREDGGNPNKNETTGSHMGGVRLSAVKTMLNDAQKWINAIVSSAGTEIGLLVVGTHADEIVSKEAATNRLAELVALMQNSLAEVECNKVLATATQVVVDNKSRNGIQDVKRSLHSIGHVLLNRMEDVKFRWLRLSELLDSWQLSEKQFCVELSQVAEKAKGVGFPSEEELMDACSYLDQLGNIIYRKEEGLKKWVFPQPQLLLTAMKSFFSHKTQGQGLSQRQWAQFTERGTLDNNALNALWNAHGFQNQEQLRMIMSHCGLILDLETHGVVVPARLPMNGITWKNSNYESEIVTRTRLSTHLPPSLFAHVLSRIHHRHGEAHQDLSLLSRSCSCLFLRPNQNNGSLDEDEFRVMISNLHLQHTVELRIRGKSSSNASAYINASQLADKCAQIIRSLHSIVRERYEMLEISTYVTIQKPCHDIQHEWCFLRTTPKLPPPEIPPHHSFICPAAEKHSLADAIKLLGSCPQSGTTKANTVHPIEGFPEPILVFGDVLALLDQPTSSPLDGSYLTKLEATEVKLVKWLAQLAKREVEDTAFKIGDSERKWIKLTARVYHCLVPLWRQKFEKQATGLNWFKIKAFLEYCQLWSPAKEVKNVEGLKVFVSHTGKDKDDYAAPLATYLRGKGVGAFLDRHSLRPGCDPNSCMLQALVTCKYLWCVVTTNFVEKWYPLRELLVGYIRHQQEPRSQFCLLIDCLEKGSNPSGQWMERIINELESLCMYDSEGGKCSFPTMFPHNRSEDVDERQKRIANMELADGRTVLDSSWL